ncbi:hypothetical protein F0L68_36205 [Solihabitans fulvus]|uniref:Uncharacterized protein n=1 Tax=Solihabitans fulvus TaxID=1892852 RepID=A0A5B2WP68_9PSEU|nr:hypothetical protein F0L68_36205 [Solihabitans fulvus]
MRLKTRPACRSNALPAGGAFPGVDRHSPRHDDVAWRAFQARQTTEFIASQAGIVRAYARADQFVTTCIAYTRVAVDDDELTDQLDVTAGNEPAPGRLVDVAGVRYDECSNLMQDNPAARRAGRPTRPADRRHRDPLDGRAHRPRR